MRRRARGDDARRPRPRPPGPSARRRSESCRSFRASDGRAFRRSHNLHCNKGRRVDVGSRTPPFLRPRGRARDTRRLARVNASTDAAPAPRRTLSHRRMVRPSRPRSPPPPRHPSAPGRENPPLSQVPTMRRSAAAPVARTRERRAPRRVFSPRGSFSRVRARSRRRPARTGSPSRARAADHRASTREAPLLVRMPAFPGRSAPAHSRDSIDPRARLLDRAPDPPSPPSSPRAYPRPRRQRRDFILSSIASRSSALRAARSPPGARSSRRRASTSSPPITTRTPCGPGRRSRRPPPARSPSSSDASISSPRPRRPRRSERFRTREGSAPEPEKVSPRR